MSLTLTRLRGSLTKNKAAIGLLGAAAVAALAWHARSSTAATTTSTGATAVSPNSTSPKPSSYTPGSAYDSTSSDVYNAIQPQLEQLQALYNQIPVPGTATTPAAAPTAEPTYGSNRDWMNAAITKWSALGRNPIDIQAALSQYTAGQPVNQAQTAGIGWAVNTLGAAPEGVAGTSAVVGNP